MSQGFKLKFDHLKENDPTSATDGENFTSVVEYPSAGNTRNICFVWLNGRKQFLNYAYLIGCDFDPEANKITMQFTTHIVTISGANLGLLLDSLLVQTPKELFEMDKRYFGLNLKLAAVFSIEVMNV